MGSQAPEYESHSEAGDVICPREAIKTNSGATNASFVFCVLQLAQVASQPVSAWLRGVGCGKELGTIA